MRSITRLSTAVGTAALFTLSFAGGGSVASAHSAVARAQATACDSTFGADAVTAFGGFAEASKTLAADKLPALGVTLITLRYKYEDTPAPAGCEDTQSALVKQLSLAEEGVLLDLGIALDTKNAVNYNDVITKVWLPRFQTAMAAMATTAIPAATPTMAAASGSSGSTCPMTFLQQFSTDSATIKFTDPTNPAIVGAASVAYITIHYKYEDATVPAGCELGTKHILQLLEAGEDYALISFAQLGDKANAATYADFLKNTIVPRAQKIAQQIRNDFLPSGAAAATMTATPS